MYTVPWIINNMILEPTDIKKSRQPSEVELKAQKSLQQLTVPDWYTNKCRASPKIIADRRPIETRPPPWKDNARKNAVSRNIEKNAAPDPVSVERRTIDEKKPVKLDFEEYREVLKTATNYLPSGSTQISKTFPKISPSRKIQNINIVFQTPTHKEPTHTAGQSVAEEKEKKKEEQEGEAKPEMYYHDYTFDKSMMSIDSLDEFTPRKMSTLENRTISATASTPIKSSGSSTLSSPKMLKSPRMKCPPPAVPTTLKNKFDISEEELARTIVKEEALFSTPEKKFSATEKILCNPARKSGNKLSLTPRKGGNIFLPSTPPSKITTNNEKDDPEESLTEEKLFTTPKKSTEMENIIKSQQKRSLNKSFVDGIIQELNAKCVTKIKPNNQIPSPNSQNFVKKLVRALEMGRNLKNNLRYDDCEEKLSGSSSDADFKSGPSSASISIKDSDSGSGSDSEIKSSNSQRSGDSPFQIFSKDLEECGKISRESITPYVDAEDESVYWIPLPTCKLPRTSSLKNMMSRLSSGNHHQGSRSSPTYSSDQSVTVDLSADVLPSALQPTVLSTINPSNQTSVSGWGETFNKRSVRSRQLFRIDETTVLDSGYSDRSETNSSTSSVVDDYWYEDSESTQTASELAEDSINHHSNHVVNPQRNMQRFYSQRISVI